MRKLVYRLVPWLILLGLIAVVYQAFTHNGLRLIQSNHAVISNHEYKDEYVRVQVAAAQEKYIIKVTALIPDVTVTYMNKKDEKKVQEFTGLFDEVTLNGLTDCQIRITNQGLFQKQIRLIEFSALSNVPEYQDVTKAREVLAQSTM